jgi:hypothetical protein
LGYAYIVINDVLEQSSGLIFTCQYAELAFSLEYRTFPAKVSRHSSAKGNRTISLATYARVINLVLRGLNWKVVLPFLDDILVLGKDFAGHLANLRAVLDRFREHGLILKPIKCERIGVQFGIPYIPG